MRDRFARSSCLDLCPYLQSWNAHATIFATADLRCMIGAIAGMRRLLPHRPPNAQFRFEALVSLA